MSNSESNMDSVSDSEDGTGMSSSEDTEMDSNISDYDMPSNSESATTDCSGDSRPGHHDSSSSDQEETDQDSSDVENTSDEDVSSEYCDSSDDASNHCQSSYSNPLDDKNVFVADADILTDIIFIVTFSVENNLSYKAMDKLVKRFVKPKHRNISSIHMLRKWLSKAQVVPDLYLICSKEGCDMFWSSGAVPNICSDCGEQLSEKKLKKEGFFFLYSKIGVLLKKLLENPETENMFLSYSQKIEASVSTSIDDIVTAERYQAIKSYFQQLPRTHPTQPHVYDFLSLVFSLDGVETSKSSIRSLEPLQIMIAELSPYIRSKKILTPFLFIGDKNKGISFKQNYIKVFVDDLIQNFNCGFEWFSDYFKKSVHTKIVALAFCADTVGKHPILGIKSHNGYNSCPLCLIPGTSVKGCSVIYKPAQFDRAGKMIEFDLREGNCRLDIENGQVVDMPAIASIPMFHPYLSTGIDPMHGIDIGVFKKIYNNIFSTTKKDYSVGANGRRRASEVMLNNIKGADFMPRNPRSLSQFKHFKASEMHMLGFFYFIPIFVELSSENEQLMRCFKNFVDLIVGLSILYGNNISSEDILEAKTNLFRFYADYTRIYGIEKCTTNIHLMVHVADSVQCLGPLWALSMYPFEAQNRKFVNSFQTNSKGILHQISERMQWKDSMEKLQKKVVDLGGECENSCARSWNLHTEGHRTTKVLGKGCIIDHSTEAARIPQLWEEICSEPESAKSYPRAQVGRTTFSTRKYHERNEKKEKNFYFRGNLNSEEVFGEILEILVVKGEVFFVYNRYTKITSPCPVQLPDNILRARHLALVQKKQDKCKEFIKVSAVDKQCIAMNIKNTNLILFGFLNHNLEVY
ncbi:hypothetical protein ACHWQZ_G002515 [Mnemiopsis leidyi]